MTSFAKTLTSLKEWDFSETRAMRDYDVFWFRSHDHEDLVGDRRALAPSFLHAVSWEQREHGVRLPPVDKLRSRELRLRTSDLISLEYLRQAQEEQIRYADAGRRAALVSMREHSGLFMPDMSVLTHTGVIVMDM
jgi:hypothetical protein